MSTKIGTVLAAMILLLSGCFELEEEVWIREDGSARVRQVIRISSLMMALNASMSEAGDPFEDLEERAGHTRDNPGVLDCSVRQETDEDSGRTITIDTEFKSYRSIEDMLSKQVVNQGFTWTKACWFTKVPDGRQAITLRLSGHAVNEQKRMAIESAREILEAMAAEAGYTFRLHAPGLADASEGGRLLEDGSMEWKFPGAGLIFDPEGVECSAVFDTPRSALERIPAALKILLLVLIIGGGIGGYLFFTRRSRARARTAPPPAP